MAQKENLSQKVSHLDSTRRVVRNSALLSALNVLIYASALLTDVATARYFGLGKETDAFFIAFTIPQLIATVLLVSVDVSLVPLFSSTLLEDSRTGLWTFSSNLINISLLSLGIVGLLGSLGSAWLISIMGAGLPATTRALASSLSAWLFVSVVPLGAIEVLKSMLYSFRWFALPAISAILANLTVFAFLLFGNSTLGIYSLAIGEVVSVVLQFIMLGIVVVTKGFHYRPILDLHDRQTRIALHQLRETIAGGGLSQLVLVLERFLAAFLPPGFVSAISYARRILRAFQSIFIGGISTALLPRMSTEFAESKLGDYKRSTSLGIKLIMLIALPVTAGVAASSLLIVQVFFLRGNFDLAAAETTAQLLGLYILSTPPVALAGFLITAFYAAMDVRTPLILRALTLMLDVCFYLVLFSIRGAEGLALAFVCVRLIVSVITITLLQRRFHFIEAALLVFLIKTAVAAFVMYLVVIVMPNLLFATASPRLPIIMQAFVIGTIGVCTYLLMLFAMRVDEMRQLIQIVWRRLGFQPL